jgi:anti-sigma factor RsiW
MLDEQFEFLLTQYLDGALSEAQAKELESRLAQDPDARALLDSYRKLDQALKSLPPVPEPDWDSNATKIASAIETQGTAIYGRPNRFRIGILPAVASALVACLLIAVGVIDRVIYHQTQPQSPLTSAVHQSPKSSENIRPSVVANAQVLGPQAEPASGPAAAQITLGPPPQTAGDINAYSDVQAVVVVRPRVTIAAATAVADDSPLSQ